MCTLATMSAAVSPRGGPSIPQWTVGDRLRKIRREYLGKMTQHQIAVLLEMRSPEQYSAWESGRTNPPHRELQSVARRIELLTGVPAAWVLGVEAPLVSAADTPISGVDKAADKGLYRRDYRQSPRVSAQVRAMTRWGTRQPGEVNYAVGVKSGAAS